MSINKENITAVILAGGQGSRLGGLDKGLVMLNQQPLIQHVITRIQPQVSKIIISANRNHEEYAALQYPVYADDIKGYAGPLAGILKALQLCQTEWLLTIPADSPYIPLDLASTLANNISSKLIAIAHDGEQLQPAFALINIKLIASLESFLAQGERKARVWMQQQPHLVVDFSAEKNAFMNINTQEDLRLAQKHFL
jgi:molybdopterin-guanine dinucleotide biosynthesis protein A